MVKRLISQEQPGKPLSDEAISKMISDQGIRSGTPHGGEISGDAEYSIIVTAAYASTFGKYRITHAKPNSDRGIGETTPFTSRSNGK